jgi:hypothetical protein
MRFARAALAGFVATIVLSILMIIKGKMGLLPDLNVIVMLAHMAHLKPVGGWVIHFAIGTLAWGLGFAALFKLLPGSAPWVKGIAFAVAAWVAMMIIVMPLAGAGLFANHLGPMAPIMTLVLHIIFGAIMGSLYGRQTST